LLQSERVIGETVVRSPTLLFFPAMCVRLIAHWPLAIGHQKNKNDSRLEKQQTCQKRTHRYLMY
jgi:hypothetical protein